jgi:hypothetical protein
METEAQHVIGDLLLRRKGGKGGIIDAPLLSAAYSRLQIHEAQQLQQQLLEDRQCSNKHEDY